MRWRPFLLEGLVRVFESSPFLPEGPVGMLGPSPFFREGTAETIDHRPLFRDSTGATSHSGPSLRVGTGGTRQSRRATFDSRLAGRIPRRLVHVHRDGLAEISRATLGGRTVTDGHVR